MTFFWLVRCNSTYLERRKDWTRDSLISGEKVQNDKKQIIIFREYKYCQCCRRSGFCQTRSATPSPATPSAWRHRSVRPWVDPPACPSSLRPASIWAVRVIPPPHPTLIFISPSKHQPTVLTSLTHRVNQTRQAFFIESYNENCSWQFFRYIFRKWGNRTWKKIVFLKI